jgi:hypothetical protein
MKVRRPASSARLFRKFAWKTFLICSLSGAVLTGCGKTEENPADRFAQLAPEDRASVEDARKNNLTPEQLRPIFEKAAKQYRIPPSVLMALAYVESRWNQGNPKAISPEDHVESFGIMGLDGHEHSGPSSSNRASNRGLERAAFLLGRTENELQTSAELNIYGGAALLKQIQELRIRAMGQALTEEVAQAWEKDPARWTNVVREYSGIFDPLITDSFASSSIYVCEIYDLIKKGRKQDPLDSEDLVSLPADSTLVDLPKECATGNNPPPNPGTNPNPNPAPSSFPGGPVRIPTRAELNMESAPASSCCWTPNTSLNPRYIVIHDTEGRWQGALHVLRNGRTDSRGRFIPVSANYLIRSSDGKIWEIVDPSKGLAYHAKNWNSLAIGIEHEARDMMQPGWYTRPMYQASAMLVLYLADRFKISLDPQHVRFEDAVFGHNFWMMVQYRTSKLRSDLRARGERQSQDHSDPGPLWRWDLYFDYLKGDSSAFQRMNDPIRPVFSKDPNPIRKGQPN